MRYSMEHYEDRLEIAREALERHKESAEGHRSDLEKLRSYQKEDHVISSIESSEYWLNYHEDMVNIIREEMHELERELQAAKSR